MAAPMRISLLIDSPLTTLLHAFRGMDKAVRAEIGKATRGAATPIWKDELAEAASSSGATQLRARLAASGKVGGGVQNVFLRAGRGKLKTGTDLWQIARAVEFGRNSQAIVRTRSRLGRPYNRLTGGAFGPNQRSGYVVYPAARASIPRFAALWIQTAVRTMHEQLEQVS